MIDYETLYLNQLDEKHLQALQVARSVLGETYETKKSNGFINFVKHDCPRHATHIQRIVRGFLVRRYINNSP